MIFIKLHALQVNEGGGVTNLSLVYIYYIYKNTGKLR